MLESLATYSRVLIQQVTAHSPSSWTVRFSLPKVFSSKEYQCCIVGGIQSCMKQHDVRTTWDLPPQRVVKRRTRKHTYCMLSNVNYKYCCGFAPLHAVHRFF